MSGGNTTWITDTLTELRARKQAQATATRQGTDAPVQLPNPNRTTTLPAPPKGGSAARNPLSKTLANMTFGDPDERKGITDDKKEVMKEVRAAIDQQVQLGTAAPVSIAIKGNRQLSGNFFSAEGHNLRTAQNNAPDTTRPVVLFLSGSGGTAEEYGTDLAEFYQESGASMLAANFRGYGGSSDCQPSEQTLLEDAQAMLQYLLDLGYPEDKIIIHGFSMGGAVAGKIQAHYEKKGLKFRGLVMDRPMVSVTGGVDAHAPDAIEEGTGGKLEKGGLLNTALTKTIGWATRQSVGSMSARKALKKSDSDSPVVVTGDEGRFAADGTALKNALLQKGSARSVTGTATNKGHLDTGAMLERNSNFIKDLIDNERDGTPVPVQNSGLSADQKKGVLKMRRAILKRIADLKSDKKGPIDDALRLTITARQFGNNMPQNYVNHVRNVRGPGIMTSLQQLLADCNEIGRLAEAAFDPDTAKTVIDLQAELRVALEGLNEAFELAGAAPTFQPEIIEATLASVAKELGRYRSFSPSILTGQTQIEKRMLGHHDTLKKMATAGVQFAGGDATLVQDVADAADEIDKRLNPPKPPPVSKPPKDAWKRNSTGSEQTRGRAKAMLRRSFS